jgi:antitoxin component YwqK of YwqJK toxin-antitoxin module
MMIIDWLTDQYPGIKRLNPGDFIVLIAFILMTVLFSSCEKTEKAYYPNGKIKFSLPKNGSGKIDGQAKFWYENGNLQLTGEYKDGVLNGKLCRYRVDGIIETEDLYVGGKLDGLCREFHYNGNVKSEMPYVNDTLHGFSRQFDDVGQIMIEGVYEHGFFEGKWVYYDRLGNLIGNAEFKKGTGVKKSYDANGNLIGIAEFKGNLKHGREIWYNASGKEIGTRYFEYGDRVGHAVESPIPE